MTWGRDDIKKNAEVRGECRGRFLGPSVFAGSPRPRLVGDAASSDEVMVLKAVRRDCPPFPSVGRALTTGRIQPRLAREHLCYLFAMGSTVQA